MLKFFNKKRENTKTEKYIIAFCDENTLTTKFGEYSSETFNTYKSAKNRIFSKACGWGKAIQEIDGDNARIDGAWLIIEKK